MNREPVRSSNIRSIGYDPGTLTLEVEFGTGTIYVYSNVPGHIHQQLTTASSKGSFFNNHIKGRFPFRQLR